MIKFRVPSSEFRVPTRNPKPGTWNGQTQTRRRSLNHGKAFLPLMCLALLVVSACGKKGDPRPPEQAVPETIRDLKAEVGREGIALTWGRPLRYADGREIRNLAGFVVFRQEIPQTRPCPECPVPYRERLTVNVEDQERFVKKKKFRFIDQELKPETTYRYRIVSQLADGTLSDRSNEAEAAWRP